MLRPLNKNLIAKRIEKEKKGILLLNDDKKNEFEVIAVSDQIQDIKAGDKILTDGYGCKEHEIDGEMFHVVHYDRVVGVMT